MRQDLYLTEILRFLSVRVDAAVTGAVKSQRRMRHKNYVASKCQRQDSKLGDTH